MPYITQLDREEYAEGILTLETALSGSENPEGDLNYIITTLLQSTFPPNKYAKINAAIGVLECAKLEYYRRGASPYEDKKIRENGDVYPAEESVISSQELPTGYTWITIFPKVFSLKD